MRLGRRRRDPVRRRHQCRGRGGARSGRPLRGRGLHRPGPPGPRPRGRPGLGRGAHPGRGDRAQAQRAAGRARPDAAPLPAVVGVLHARRVDRHPLRGALRHGAHPHRRLHRVDPRDHPVRRLGVTAAAGLGCGRLAGPDAARLGGHPRRDHPGLDPGPAPAEPPGRRDRQAAVVRSGGRCRAGDSGLGPVPVRLPPAGSGRGQARRGRRRRPGAPGARLRVGGPAGARRARCRP